MYIADQIKSSDDMATKYVQTTFDDHRVETLYVNYPNKHIICYSTQIGCPCGCQFCYSGIQAKFSRNLNEDEIVKQCVNVIEDVDPSEDKPILFSAMGVGEPLLNYFSYIRSIDMLYDKYPNCKFAMATSGSYILGRLDSFARILSSRRTIDFKLTISLHSANPEQRALLMPRAANVDQVIAASKYFKRTAKRPVEYNITLIDGVNDSLMAAHEMIRMFGRHRILSSARIKINRFNEIPGCEFKGSTHVDKYIKTLVDAGMHVEYYETNGSDIGGACGQMAAN